MRQKLLFVMTAMLVSVAAMAQWTKPVPEHVDSWKYTEDGDTTIYYLYLKDAGAFFTEGNAYGTQASIGPTGLKVMITKYIPKDGEWDGKTVLFNDFSIIKGEWRLVYINSQNDSFIDRNTQDNYFWEIESKGDGVYRIKGADINPSFNSASYGATSGGAYYGMSYLNNEKTTAISPLIDPGEDETAQIDWYFISEEGYAAYLEKFEVYDAAQTLYAKIEESKEYGIATAEAEAVYANTSSTLEQLKAAIEAQLALINDYKENSASPDDPKDLTETYIPDADFEQNAGAGVWQRKQTPEAQNFQTNGTPEKQGDDTFFLESWNGSPYSGKIYVPLTGLPNGVYQFTLSAFTTAGEKAYVYAGNDSTEVTTTNMTPYTVFTCVEDGTMEVGLSMPESIHTWVGIDDAKLLYFGNSVASYAYWVKYNMESSPKYDDDSFVQVAALEEYNKILNTDLYAFATKEEVLAFNDTYNEAINVIKANAEAYAQYKVLVDEAEGLQVVGYAGEEADELYDYLTEGATDIMETRNLSTEEMLAECEKVQKMIEVVKANCLAAGMACTNLLTNPNFDKRMEGWSWDNSLGTPAWGGLESNPCVERWNENFNFYQTVANVPNGVYELTVQAFYRPTGSTKGSYENYVADPAMDEILASIYVNSSEAPVKNIAAHTYSENLESNCEAVTSELFVPNGMNSASNAFSNGDYVCKVAGVVTDGNLTVGIKCTEGTISGRWSLWDNFELTFLGMEKSAIDDLIASYAEQIETLQEETMGADAVDALNEANKAAADATDGNEAFAALTSLINAVNAAKASAQSYAGLEEAINSLAEALESASESNPVFSKANTMLDEVTVAFGTGAYTTDEANAKIEEIGDVIARLSIPDYSEASDDNPVDFTATIVNPSFETGDMTGWTAAKGDDTGVKENSNATYTISNADGSYVFNTWKGAATFDYSVTQTIKYLPAGVYELKALLASDAGNKVSLSANGGAVEFAISGAKETAQEESITFAITEGKDLTIAALAKNWFKADNFQLFYYGTSSSKELTGIEDIASVPASAPAAIFTISGARVNSLQKGINIVRTADGKVKRVFVK